MAYITYDIVRLFTNLTSDDISDEKLTSIITYCTAQLNRDINTRVIREKIESIDNTRTNKIDGTNSTYFVKNWEGKYIADSNDDGSVTISDLTVYQVDSSSVETTLTISTITASEGKFTVSTMPSSVTLYVSYDYAKVSATHSLVKLAMAYLVAAVAYSKINVGQSTSFSVGEIRVVNHINSFKEYYDLYTQIVQRINDGMVDSIEHDLVV